MQFRQSRRFRINAPDVINEVIEGEAIILHLGTGRYYSARGCGADVWRWLSGSAGSDDITAALTATYDASAEDIAEAVDNFVEYLLQEGLLVEASTSGTSDAAALTAEESTVKTPFEPPALESFSDLEDLLLLDPVHEVSTEQGWPHVAASADGG